MGKDTFSTLEALYLHGATPSQEGAQLDGVGASVELGCWELGGDLSIEVLVRPEGASSGFETIFDFGCGIASTNIQLAANTTESTARFWASPRSNSADDDTRLNATDFFESGEWVHALCVVKNGEWHLYKNGVLSASRIGYSPKIARRTSHLVGRNHSKEGFFQGTIAFLRVWHCPLSDEMIPELFERRNVTKLFTQSCCGHLLGRLPSNVDIAKNYDDLTCCRCHNTFQDEGVVCTRCCKTTIYCHGCCSLPVEFEGQLCHTCKPVNTAIRIGGGYDVIRLPQQDSRCSQETRRSESPHRYLDTPTQNWVHGAP